MRHGVAAFGLIVGRRSLSGSPIGGIHETHEMLDICGAHNVTTNVEVIPIQKINEAYDRLLKSDGKTASPSIWRLSTRSKPTAAVPLVKYLWPTCGRTIVSDRV